MTPFATMMFQYFGIKPRGLHSMPRVLPKHVARNVLSEVARETGVSPVEMMGSARDRRVTHARQLAYSRFRDMGFSYALIGRTMRKDHSTVLYGVRQVAAR